MTKQGLTKSHLGVIWAFFWLAGVWLGAVLGSTSIVIGLKDTGFYTTLHPKRRPKSALTRPYLDLVLGWGWYRNRHLHLHLHLLLITLYRYLYGGTEGGIPEFHNSEHIDQALAPRPLGPKTP